jgi:hypothetical protein
VKGNGSGFDPVFHGRTKLIVPECAANRLLVAGVLAALGHCAPASPPQPPLLNKGGLPPPLLSKGPQPFASAALATLVASCSPLRGSTPLYPRRPQPSLLSKGGGYRHRYSVRALNPRSAALATLVRSVFLAAAGLVSAALALVGW